MSYIARTNHEIFSFAYSAEVINVLGLFFTQFYWAFLFFVLPLCKLKIPIFSSFFENRLKIRWAKVRAIQIVSVGEWMNLI